MGAQNKADVQKVIDVLNQARSMELQAIHQYMIQHYLLDGMDYGKLCAYMKLIAIDEMRHAETFAERIDALGGSPTCEKAGGVSEGQDIREIYPYDANMESETVAQYKKFAAVCSEYGDEISAGIFHAIIKDEEIHLGYYEDTSKHLKTLGDTFLAKYAATSKHSGPIKSFVRLMEKEEF